MTKQTEIYPHNRILSNKKEWSIDTCSKVNDCQNHCVKWEKPILEAYICVIPYMKHSWNGKIIMMENRSAVTKN